MNIASFSTRTYVSDPAANPGSRSALAQRRRIRILRDDHIGETLGAIFLDPAPDQQEWTLALLGEYLGPRIQIHKVELYEDRAEVDIETRTLPAEAERLTAAAHDLRRKGARKAALGLFREALALNPLSHAAGRGAGLLMLELERLADALQMLKRAHELGADDPDVLHALGQASLKQDRMASAIVYFERACEIAPDHFAARRALAELGRKPRNLPRSHGEKPAEAAPLSRIQN